MAEQAWGWCLALGGEDMTAPSYSYPWQDDGREADAPESVRRYVVC